MKHYCQSCQQETDHFHCHDTVYGIPETHLAGSERFECNRCKRMTFSTAPDAHTFPFIIDKPVCPSTKSPS